MSLPQYTNFINPVISILNLLGGSGRPAEIYNLVADLLELTEEEISEQKKSGGSVYKNRVAWARFYLAKAGYIDSSRHGVWTLTDKGRSTKSFTEDEIQNLVRDVQNLTPRVKPKAKTTSIENSELDKDSSPPTSETNYIDELRSIIQSITPDGFERLCLYPTANNFLLFITDTCSGPKAL